MARIRICKEGVCQDAATTEGYCRLHYLKHWKIIRESRQKRSAKKLDRYVGHVMKNHPGRYLEVIKKDLRSPNFDKYIMDNFPDDEEISNFFDEPILDDEVEELFRQMKIEKGY